MTLVSVLRRFNRTYTQRIGVLDDSYLGTGRPLNVSRLLFEIGQSGAPTVRELRERLSLDSGYLSRLIAVLDRDGLIALAPDAHDRRRRVVTLTESGRRAVVLEHVPTHDDRHLGAGRGAGRRRLAGGARRGVLDQSQPLRRGGDRA